MISELAINTMPKGLEMYFPKSGSFSRVIIKVMSPIQVIFINPVIRHKAIRKKQHPKHQAANLVPVKNSLSNPTSPRARNINNGLRQ